MIIGDIIYSKKFIKRFKKLPKNIAKKAIETEKIFKANPLHPSIRLHELHGDLKKYWSISINRKYRIIFKQKSDGNIYFIFIGNHNIYDALK